MSDVPVAPGPPKESLSSMAVCLEGLLHRIDIALKPHRKPAYPASSML
jgi:hypothetical protein